MEITRIAHVYEVNNEFCYTCKQRGISHVIFEGPQWIDSTCAKCFPQVGNITVCTRADCNVCVKPSDATNEETHD